MKVHNISIDSKYFEPIREGKITLLIFDTKIIHDSQPGDYIVASKGIYDVKAKISSTYIKAFRDITDEEAAEAGFLNRDFLKDELLSRFELNPVFSFETGKSIDNDIFFLIKINTKEEEHYTINNPVKVNLYGKNYKTQLYEVNPEYNIPWSDYYDEKI